MWKLKRYDSQGVDTASMKGQNWSENFVAGNQEMEV